MKKSVLYLLIYVLVLYGCSSMKSKVIVGDDYNTLSETNYRSEYLLMYPYLYVHFEYGKKLNLINDILKNPNEYFNVLKSSEFYDSSIEESFTSSILADYKNNSKRDITTYNNYYFPNTNLNVIYLLLISKESFEIKHKMGFRIFENGGGISFIFLQKKGKWYLTHFGLLNREEFENEKNK